MIAWQRHHSVGALVIWQSNVQCDGDYKRCTNEHNKKWSSKILEQIASPRQKIKQPKQARPAIVHVDKSPPSGLAPYCLLHSNLQGNPIAREAEEHRCQADSIQKDDEATVGITKHDLEPKRERSDREQRRHGQQPGPQQIVPDPMVACNVSCATVYEETCRRGRAHEGHGV